MDNIRYLNNFTKPPEFLLLPLEYHWHLNIKIFTTYSVGMTYQVKENSNEKAKY